MKVVERKIEAIRPYENNPRNNENAIQGVVNSIREFGFKVPIVVDKDGTIVAGHTRYAAAIQLGMSKVPCIVADDLTDEQVKAFRLADNKVAEAATWDFEKLDAELKGIMDIDMTDLGFADADEHFFDDYESQGNTGDEEPKGYNISYNLTFNNEQEQDTWHEYLKWLKRKYPEVETISERILLQADEDMDNDG